jgi:hypothetical protein
VLIWEPGELGGGAIVRLMSVSALQDGRMAKARQVRRALERAGWEFVGMVGSHFKF